MYPPEGVAHQVRSVEGGVVHCAFDRVREDVIAGVADDYRSARVPSERRCEHFVFTLECG